MSDEVIISSWTVLACVIGYLFIRQSQQEKRIALAENNVQHMNEDLKNLIAAIRSDMKDDFSALNTRLDGFLTSEISILKEKLFRP